MTNWSDAYKRYSPEIQAFLERRLWGHVDEAEDLCQETFTRVVAAAVEMRDPSKIRSYLYRTANNLVISKLRRKQLVSTESQLGAGEGVEIYSTRADDKSIDPHNEAERNELKTRMEELLATLPDDQRYAFEQGVLQRRPYADIARERNWNETKVKVSVYRARKRLMAGLEDFR
jgi:RNA polymerase sigma-70 factor (ECF subfamily)